MRQTLHRSIVTALVVSLLASQSAFAWGPRGHKVIASIAYQKLAPTQRQALADVLRHHPRFADDFEEEMPTDVSAGDQEMQNEWIFQQAAIWPDIARGFAGPLKAQFHRPT